VCSNINTNTGFLKISKRCKINCISGHIVPYIYNSLARKFDTTRQRVGIFCRTCIDWIKFQSINHSREWLIDLNICRQLQSETETHSSTPERNMVMRWLRGCFGHFRFRWLYGRSTALSTSVLWHRVKRRHGIHVRHFVGITWHDVWS